MRPKHTRSGHKPDQVLHRRPSPQRRPETKKMPSAPQRRKPAAPRPPATAARGRSPQRCYLCRYTKMPCSCSASIQEPVHPRKPPPPPTPPPAAVRAADAGRNAANKRVIKPEKQCEERRSIFVQTSSRECSACRAGSASPHRGRSSSPHRERRAPAEPTVTAQPEVTSPDWKQQLAEASGVSSPAALLTEAASHVAELRSVSPSSSLVTQSAASEGATQTANCNSRDTTVGGTTANSNFNKRRLTPGTARERESQRECVKGAMGESVLSAYTSLVGGAEQNCGETCSGATVELARSPSVHITSAEQKQLRGEVRGVVVAESELVRLVRLIRSMARCDGECLVAAVVFPMLQALSWLSAQLPADAAALRGAWRKASNNATSRLAMYV